MSKKKTYVYIYLHENKVTVCHGEEDDNLSSYMDVTVLRYWPEEGTTEVAGRPTGPDPDQKYECH